MDGSDCPGRTGAHNLGRRPQATALEARKCLSPAALRGRGIRLTRKQIVEITMVTGGIPHYLKEVGKGMSAAQVIDFLCFRPKGLLRDEFDRLYPSLFARPESHLSVVRALSKSPGGLTRNDLAKKTQLPSGGCLSNVLNELDESGFVEASLTFGYNGKDKHKESLRHLHHHPRGDAEPLRARTRAVRGSPRCVVLKPVSRPPAPTSFIWCNNLRLTSDVIVKSRGITLADRTTDNSSDRNEKPNS